MIDESTADPWGVTTLEVFERIESALETDDRLAVATVVAVEGSAYRRPGAKMLLGADGTLYGGITAGCLEGPLRDVAADVLATGDPTVVTFDLTDDGDGWGLGLGCEGVVDVLVEPIDESWRAPTRAFHDGDPTTIVTVVESDGTIPVGARAVVEGDRRPSTPGDRSPLPDSVLDSVRNSLSDEAEEGAHGGVTNGSVDRLDCSTDDGSVTLFVDAVDPARRLVIFGGQPDVRPVTRLAREVGFRVVVATARGGHADPEAFPRADRVVSTHPTDLAELVDDRTSVVLMSHNLLDDRLALESILETDAPYIGLMGPRDRFDRLLEDLRDDGVTLSEADRERIATPVGLDLGGGEPIEIALSIVAELVATSNDREGGRLSDRRGPIHGPSPTSSGSTSN